MAQITRDAFLVGMKYHGFSFLAGQTIHSEAIALRREPSNPYDPNAIAVYISGAIAGHVDKGAAAIIAPLLDGGARWRVGPISSANAGRSSVPLKIALEQEIQSVPPPKLAPAKAIGIYLISIRGFDEVYVGQSRDISERIKSHWRELNHGVHSNPVMRRLWKERGGKHFDAVIIEEATTGLNDHELSLWLQSREEHWIEQYDLRSGVLNFDIPSVVLVGAERVEARKSRLAAREASRVLRERRKAIEVALEGLLERVSTKHQQVREAEGNIRAASGIRGFFFATDAQKYQAKDLVAVVQNLRSQIQRLDAEYDHLYEERRKLPDASNSGRRRLRKR